MFVVIPTAVEINNPSLRFALTSISAHTGHTPVTIGYDTGHRPHISTRQERNPASRFRNTDLAMRVACRTDWIGEAFIWSNDDIYWRTPADPIRYAVGDLTAATGNNVYVQRKHATARFLQSRGLPTFDYEAHTPMLINRGPMLTVLQWVSEDDQLDKRSLYGNLTGLPDVVTADVKLRHHRDPLPDSPWFSTRGNPMKYEAVRRLVRTSTTAGVGSP